MAALGFKPEDYSAEVPVWFDCWDSVQMFSALSTQWRTGPGGPVGLDYNVLFTLAERRQIVGDAFDQLLSDIQVLERAAMATMRATQASA